MKDISVNVKLTPSVELCASMFAEMGSDEQAETLALIWRKMQEWGYSNAAMQCLHVRESLDADGRAFLDELDEPSEEPTSRRADVSLSFAEECTAGVPPSEPWTTLDPYPLHRDDTVMQLDPNRIQEIEMQHDEGYMPRLGECRAVAVKPRMVARVTAPVGVYPNDHVQIAGYPAGRVIETHSDGTISVEFTPVPNQDDPAGDVPGDPNFTIAPFDGGSTPTECPECRGTGWYEGFMKREPCSRGCRG